MNRNIFSAAFCALLLALNLPAQAQQAGKVPRIGYLDGASLSGSEGRIGAFQQGLRDLGYVEGKNIIIEWRYAEEKRIACVN
jgi:putative ABC transport system substrate-binding protein